MWWALKCVYCDLWQLISISDFPRILSALILSSHHKWSLPAPYIISSHTQQSRHNPIRGPLKFLSCRVSYLGRVKKIICKMQESVKDALICFSKQNTLLVLNVKLTQQNLILFDSSSLIRDQLFSLMRFKTRIVYCLYNFLAKYNKLKIHQFFPYLQAVSIISCDDSVLNVKFSIFTSFI